MQRFIVIKYAEYCVFVLFVVFAFFVFVQHVCILFKEFIVYQSVFVRQHSFCFEAYIALVFNWISFTFIFKVEKLDSFHLVCLEVS